MWRKPDGYSSNSLTIKNNNEDEKYKINKDKIDLKDSNGGTIGYDKNNVEVLCYQEPQEEGGWVEDELNEIENYSWFHDENPVINKYFICDTNDKHYIRRKDKTKKLLTESEIKEACKNIHEDTEECKDKIDSPECVTLLDTCKNFTDKCYDYVTCETQDYKNIWNALNFDACNKAGTTCEESLKKIGGTTMNIKAVKESLIACFKKVQIQKYIKKVK